MIRGVDRQVRKAVKNAAKSEGVGVGVWVRRALVRALDKPADDPATVLDLKESVRALRDRLSILEKSHDNLRRSLHGVTRTGGGRTAAKIRK
jgi:hypothetical protein